MRVAHILRKYDPAEWGGTESALRLLLEGLRAHEVESVVFAPRLEREPPGDPLAAAGATVRRFRATLPIWGITPQRRQQLVAVGGNLLSFDLPRALWSERDVRIVHAHTLGRLGGVALTVARWRGIPLVVSVHGGALDLPAGLKEELNGRHGGFEWGKLFGWYFRSRRLLEQADAILTCNPREAELLSARYPGQRVLVQPHGVPVRQFATDHRVAARAAFLLLERHQLILCVGRIDPVKNQLWLVEQMPEIVRRHPQAMLVLAGACTDEAYGSRLAARIGELGLKQRVLLTGGLPPAGERLIGLLQLAAAVVVPSVSETFGLVILEAWAAGAPVVASKTSGAGALIEHGKNGWLFDHGDAAGFHLALEQTVNEPEQLAAAAYRRATEEYDTTVLAGRLKRLYAELIAQKGAPRHEVTRP